MPLLLRLALVVMILLSAQTPAQAEEEKGGFQKIDNLIVEMWDKQGNFHMMVAKMQAYFPARPNMAKGLGEKMKHKLQAIPYEEFRKPGGTELLKSVVKSVLLEDPGSENVEDVFVIALSFQ